MELGGAGRLTDHCGQTGGFDIEGSGGIGDRLGIVVDFHTQALPSGKRSWKRRRGDGKRGARTAEFADLKCRGSRILDGDRLRSTAANLYVAKVDG